MHFGGGEMLAREFALAHGGEFRAVFALLDDIGDLGREMRGDGHVVEVIGRRPGFDGRCAGRLRAFLRRENVQLVHAHQYGPLLYSALARLPRRRIPILFTEHGRDEPDYRRRKRVSANRLLLTRRDRFVAVGERVRQALIEYEGLPAQRVEVIYNGRDLTAYDPRRPLRRQVRAELGLPDESFVVIQVARLNRLKDHPTALRGFRRVVDTVPLARLLLVGDGEERPSIERMIRELHLQNVVHLLGSRDDVPRLLQAADVFLLTSITEGIPLTLIEAMATGLPCVATRAGGVDEVVVNKETGLLSDVGDAGSLAEQLCFLANGEDVRRRFGRAGHSRVKLHFDARRMHKRYRSLYIQLTSDQVSTARSYDRTT